MQDSISMDVLFYQRDPERGWQFKPDQPGCTADTAAGGLRFIQELYERQDSKEKSVSVLHISVIVSSSGVVPVSEQWWNRSCLMQCGMPAELMH